MTERRELPGLGELFQRIGLQAAVVSREIIKNAGLENKESAVNPAFTNLWFFGEGGNKISLQLQPAKAGWRAHGSNGCDEPV